ncbi:MAG TPA: DUF4249 family protein, partial [Bacteroidales bacterium]|nr:DUF4249 family protein [Bacteroidales bacterium]
MKRILNIIVIISFICGCEHETEWEIKPDQSILIADCIITNEFKRHEVYLYWSSDSLNQPVTGYSGAAIEITDGINYYSFSEDVINSGKYYSDVAFRATAERNYRLTISFEGNSDTAFASMTGVSP